MCDNSINIVNVLIGLGSQLEGDMVFDYMKMLLEMNIYDMLLFLEESELECCLKVMSIFVDIQFMFGQINENGQSSIMMFIELFQVDLNLFN